MTVILERQISDSDKKQILERFGRVCYATGHEIPENETVHFDHIRAFSKGGVSEIDNIAPMCQQHNLEKSALPLEDFRVKLHIERFFHNRQALTLKHELEYLIQDGSIHCFGLPVYASTADSTITIKFANTVESFKLYTCPVTNWEYFYAALPVDAINSDDDEDGKIGLQPRYLIPKKVFDLYRHFQNNTVIHPSIARLHNNRVLVFDGQHKIAAMLWGGRREFELKIYVSPDPERLNQTNIAAHDQFTQTRFYSSVMVAKLGNQFGSRFDKYRRTEKGKKSESGFIKFLITDLEIPKSTAIRQLLHFIYNGILDNSVNKLERLVSMSNRSTDEYPLSIDILSKSIFANFIYRQPTDDDIDSTYYKRDEEIKNTIHLCNLLDEEILHEWNASKPKTDDRQIKLNRITRSKSIIAWSELLRDAITCKLDITDRDEQVMPFYRQICEEDFEKIRSIIHRLGQWSQWILPANSEIDRILADNKSEVKRYFKQHGLTTGYLLGAPE